MTLTTEIRAQLEALEVAHRKVGLCTVRTPREALPKRVLDQLSTSELDLISRHINSHREDATPISGVDIKSRQAGDA